MAHESVDDATLLIGRNPVRELLAREPERFEKVMIQKGAGGREISEIRRMAGASGVQVQHVPPQRLQKLARGLNHQGVAAITSPLAYVQVDEMLEGIADTPDAVRATKPRILLLDGIQDPFNLGAIYRSAVAAGLSGVIVPSRNMAPFNTAAVKASAGTVGRIPVARVGNLSETIYQLKERGYWIAGADTEGEVSVWEMDWDRPIGLVIGSEGEGIRRRVLELCDYRIRIPMPGPAESLNASVAAGILMFAATR